MEIKLSKTKYPVIIDIHSHIRVPEVLDFMKDHPITATGPGTDDWYVDNSRSSAGANMVELEKQRYKVSTDPEERIRQLDQRKVDIQVISVNFPNTCYWMTPENGLHAAKLANNSIADFCSYKRDRLIPLGVVPMQAPELAAAELERCVKELGFRGAWINSHVQSKDIGLEQFRPFWAKAEELDVPVFVHPLNAVDFDRLKNQFRFNAIGNPLEEMFAMSSLIYEGIMDDFPKLKAGICHGGGYLPYYPGRVDYCYDTNRGGAADAFKQRPSEYFKRFFYDTNTFDKYSLEILIKRAGVSQIMYGSDWPAISESYFDHVDGMECISEEDKQRIVWKNAAELFKISV